MECGPPFVLLPVTGGVSGKHPRDRIMSYLPSSLSFPASHHPHPWAPSLGDFHRTGEGIKLQPVREKCGLHVAPGERLVSLLQRGLDGVACTGARRKQASPRGLGAGTPVSFGLSGLGWLLPPQGFSLFLAELGNDNTPNHPYLTGCWGKTK